MTAPTNANTDPNSVRLHRVLRAPAERVFRAFTDPHALVKWMAPHGFTAQVHSIDPRTGGTYRMAFTNFNTGQTHSFGGTYIEIIPNQLIRHTDAFDDANLPGTMQNTITFRPVTGGTELIILQENIPPMIPAEMCYMGWQESLELLTKLVEPEIP